MACECCNQPPGTSISFKCESFSASHSIPWCGYDSFIAEDPPKRYKTKTSESLWETNQETEWEFSYSDEYYSYSSNGSYTELSRLAITTIRHRVVDEGVCKESIDSESGCSGVYLVEFQETNVFDEWETSTHYRLEVPQNKNCTDGEADTFCRIDGEDYPEGSCHISVPDCGGESSSTTEDMPATTATKRYLSWTSKSDSSSSASCSGSFTQKQYESEELSEDVPKPTLEEVLEGAIDKLPSESNGTSCSAVKTVSSDELTVAIRKAKIKLTHSPTGTCYLKVWLRKRFRPAGTTGDDDVLTALSAYEWSASGNPCFSDPDKSPDDDANKIESDEYELDIPDEPGTLSLEIARYSLLPDYTPDEDLDDGTRPSPDTKPNGFPL